MDAEQGGGGGGDEIGAMMMVAALACERHDRGLAAREQKLGSRAVAGSGTRMLQAWVALVMQEDGGSGWCVVGWLGRL